MQIFFGSNSIVLAIGGLLLTRSWIGAVVGFLIGSYFDRLKTAAQKNRQEHQQSGRQTSYEDFIRQQFGQQRQSTAQFSSALLILSAEVMKADGKVLRAELDYVKQFLVQQFGREYAPQYLQELKGYLNQQSNLEQTCYNFRNYIPHQQKQILVQYLFGIAQSDGNVSNTELNVIQRIASLLGLRQFEFDQLKSMFWKDSANAYSTLGLGKEASDSEVKAAYRKLAREHHPDKVASLGEQHQKAAKEKFQKIQEAYETVKKERGL
jgi:DnaJ like chaperone protein